MNQQSAEEQFPQPDALYTRESYEGRFENELANNIALLCTGDLPVTVGFGSNRKDYVSGNEVREALRKFEGLSMDKLVVGYEFGNQGGPAKRVVVALPPEATCTTELHPMRRSYNQSRVSGNYESMA